MSETPINPALQRAFRVGFGGILLVVSGMVWVFLRPEGAIFGVAEGLTTIGMIMVLSAAWMAAEATAEEER